MDNETKLQLAEDVGFVLAALKSLVTPKPLPNEIFHEAVERLENILPILKAA